MSHEPCSCPATLRRTVPLLWLMGTGPEHGGGLDALRWTESVQALLLISSVFVVAVAAFAKAGGWHSVMTGVDPAMLSLIRPIGDPGVPWPRMLLGIPVLDFYYWCTK